MAASNINRVVLTGNLTRDPELRSLQSGTSVCSLRIASNTRRKENGEWVDKPNYFSVTVWGAQGENCARFLSKGRPVCIDGRLEWREWQGQDGTKRESVEIVADVRPVPRRPRRRAGGGGQGGGQATTTASPRTRTSRRTRRTSRRSPSARATARRRTTTSRSRPLASECSEGRRLGGPSSFWARDVSCAGTARSEWQGHAVTRLPWVAAWRATCRRDRGCAARCPRSHGRALTSRPVG